MQVHAERKKEKERSGLGPAHVKGRRPDPLVRPFGVMRGEKKGRREERRTLMREKKKGGGEEALDLDIDDQGKDRQSCDRVECKGEGKKEEPTRTLR